MLWIVAAAQVTAPLPLQVHSWFSANDVPEYLLAHSDDGVWMVPVRLTVAPDGNIRSCQPEASSKIAALDAHTCSIVLHRAHFRPALVDGVPTFGVYRTTVKYFISQRPWDISKSSYPDVDLTVKSLPAGLKSPTLVRVMFAVDANGTKTSCAADGSDGMEKVDNHPALIPVACDQVMSGYQAIPAMEAGKPISSVQNAIVRFSTSASR